MQAVRSRVAHVCKGTYLMFSSYTRTIGAVYMSPQLLVCYTLRCNEPIEAE